MAGAFVKTPATRRGESKYHLLAAVPACRQAGLEFLGFGLLALSLVFILKFFPKDPKSVS